jgi:hypothetical protein
MRLFLLAIAAALILAGGVWIFQGAGLLKGSFMTGRTQWLSIGIACAVLGAGLLIGTLRSTRR